MVVIDNFRKFAWTIPLKDKNSQTIKDSFEKNLKKSKRYLNLTETDRGKKFYNNIFQMFLYNNNIKHYSRNTNFGAVFAERFNRTVTALQKRPLFEKGDGNWVDFLPRITKQYNNRVLTSTKLTSMQASFKKNESYAYKNLLDKRKRKLPGIQINNLVRVADLKKMFSKSDLGLINWSYKVYKNKKRLMIQYRVIAMMFLKKDILNHY